MKRVGIYIRVSTEEQARIQDGSLVSQRQRLLEYVDGQIRREKNWGSVVDIYCDEGKSAKDMNRPEFQRLLQDVKTGRINLILATELSRLSRSIRDFCELWDIFKKHQSSFITLREQFDTTSAAGEMMVFNLINFAQFERKQTAERISANWLSRAKRGLWNGGSMPLGFDRNPRSRGELLLNPVEAEQVKKIFSTFLHIGSVRQTCRELTKMGYFSKKFINKHGVEKGGGHFTVPSLYRILTNRAYIGLREVNGPNSQADVVKASWSPIVDLEIFNQVQEKLSANRNKTKPEEWKKYPYPMTEILICGECGKHLGGKSAHGKTKKHHYYGHPRQLHSDGVSHLKRCRLERVRAERIETMSIGALKTLITKPGLLDHWMEVYTQSSSSEIPALEGRLKSLDSDIGTNENRMKNLVMRISDLPSDVSADIFFEQIKELKSKVVSLKSTKDELMSKSKVLKGQQIDKDALKAKVARTLRALEHSPVERQKPIFSNLIKFAELHPNRIRIGLYAPVGGIDGTPGPEKQKATGTEGIPQSLSGLNLNGNLKMNSENLLPFCNRGSSTTVTNGAPGQT